MIELEFAELHGPIFINGTNLAPKLIPGDAPGHRRDIKLFYDRGERELYVHFKGKVGIVPRENVAMMVEKPVEKKAIPFEEPSKLAEPKKTIPPRLLSQRNVQPRLIALCIMFSEAMAMVKQEGINNAIAL